MIVGVADNLNIIFIHPPRTGGTSIESQIIGKLDFPTKHVRASYYPDEMWKNSFSFATVRNPFDILVSRYKTRWYAGESGIFDGDYIDDKNLFLRWLIVFLYEGGHQPNEHGKFLIEYLDRDVDLIIRHENRKDDIVRLNEVFKEKNINLQINSDIHISKFDGSDYRDYYNEDAIKIASEFYQTDLEKFNYKF